MTPQPISTAPKGQRVLVYCFLKSIDEGWWEIGSTNSFDEWINDEFSVSLMLTQPTLWLPLPPIPTQPQTVKDKMTTLETSKKIIAPNKDLERYLSRL